MPEDLVFFFTSIDNCGGNQRKFIFRGCSLGRVPLHEWILQARFVTDNFGILEPNEKTETRAVYK